MHSDCGRHAGAVGEESDALGTSADAVCIGLQRDGLLLSDVDRRGGDIWSCRARLVVPGLVAEKTRVAAHYSLMFDDLIDYFGGLAAAWRGWDGTRIYESLEGDLRLEAANAGSRVRLGVTLWESSQEDGWRVSAVIELEAGEQLARTASDVKDLLGR